jgi:hypothetical protein
LLARSDRTLVERSSKTVTVRGELVEPFFSVKIAFDKLRPNGLFVIILLERTTRTILMS